MEKRTLRYAVVGFVGVVAVALAAATLNSTRESSQVGTSGDSGGGGGLVATTREVTQTTSPGASLFVTVIVLLFVVAAVAYVLFYRTEALRIGLVVLAFVAVVLVVIQLGAPTPQLADQSQNQSGERGIPNLESGEGPPAGSFSAPTMLLVLLVGALLVVSVGAFAAPGFSPLDAFADDEETEEPTDDVAVEQVGEAAGRAADRLDAADVDVDNEVYRAWREMTDHLDIRRPQSSTPGEFAAAAVDAGLDRGDVTELTRLFEEVRYGDRDPTERADRAVAILRRIEDAYGSEAE